MKHSDLIAWQRQAILATHGLPSSVLAAALVISIKATEADPVFCRQADIADPLDLSLEATRRAIRHLVRLGLLQIEPTRQGAWYRLEGGQGQ